MRFYTPTIGDEVYLTKPWTFDVYNEYRNNSLFKKGLIEGNARYGGNENVGKITLPVNTKLVIDRIYIRGKGITARSYDSVTFRIKECSGNPKAEKARFWVKLRDANRIECDLYPILDTEAPVAKDRFEAILDE